MIFVVVSSYTTIVPFESEQVLLINETAISLAALPSLADDVDSRAYATKTPC